MSSHMDTSVDDLRQALQAARHERGWSQAELGRRVGLPQAHISGIETGKVIPRYDTMLELVRVLGHDLILVPRALVPAIQALVRGTANIDEDERPLYVFDDEQGEAQ